MPTTLLAVDDSVTMRKVIEITFAGEEFRVVTAESADAALKKARAEKPQIVLLDVTLPEMDGYAVCRALKQEFPALGIVIMSAKQAPYDASRGAAAGADDFIDKPFDTQQMIDKVKKVATAKANAPAATAAPPPPPPPPARPAAPSAPAQAEAAKVGGTLPGTSAPAARPVAPSAPAKGTAIFPAGSPAPSPVAPVAAKAPAPPTPPVGVQRPAPIAAPTPIATPAVSAPAPQHATQPALVAAVDSQMGEKLSGLGLNPQQAEAVLALSREVIERIVWEVVPQLAETLIKEEIRRLTAEG